jgi:hypothetical protein
MESISFYLKWLQLLKNRNILKLVEETEYPEKTTNL